MRHDRKWLPFTAARLLEPFSLAEFHDAYYEKQPLVIKRRSPVHYEHLLTLDDVNDLLGETCFPAAAIRLVRDGESVAAKDFTYPEFSINSRWSGGTVDKDVLFAKLYEGYTIVLMEYASAAMLRLRHDLERAFHATALVHIYLTPGDAQGLAPHWDTHDTFILQFTGTKDWLIYGSPITLPTRRQRTELQNWTKGEPTLKATLEPGDFLYVPRGFVHEARSGDAVSGHATIGLHTKTYADLLRQIADNAQVDPWMRRSLPVDYRSVASNDEFLRHVHAFFDRADLAAYVERMHGDFAGDRLPDATDRLADYVKLASIGPGSRFRKRSVVDHELTNGGDEAVLTFHQKSLRFPAGAAESIRRMIDAGEFTASALPGSHEDNLALCATLVREGFLTIV
jgi:Cupin superfamily protein